MKKTKLIVLFLIMCISLLSVAYVTYGWFVSVKRTGSVYFKTGEVKYVMTDDSFKNNFYNKSYIVPGEELLKSNIYIINKSTISSNLRVKIEVEVNGTKYIVDNNNKFIIAELVDTWIYDTTDDTQCWYYTVNNSQVIENLANSTNLDILESIKLNGNAFGTSIEKKKVKITLYFQGKQSNYATWEDLGSITKNY